MTPGGGDAGSVPRPAPARSGRAPARERFPRLVLVVDDDEDLRSSIAIALEDEGWRVLEVSNADEALEVLPSVEGGVVLTDYRMPGMNGGELYETIRARHDHAFGVVLMTAAADVRDLAARHGFTLFLGKPFGVEELLASLERARDGSGPDRPG